MRWNAVVCRGEAQRSWARVQPSRRGVRRLIMEDGRECFRLHKYNMNSVQHNGAVFRSALFRRGEQTCSPQEYHARIPGECEHDTQACGVPADA